MNDTEPKNGFAVDQTEPKKQSNIDESACPVARFVNFKEATPEQKREGSLSLGKLPDVPLTLRVELGRAHITAHEFLRLDEGSVVELEKMAGEPVDLFLQDTHFANGEVAVVEGSFRVRVTDVLTNNSQPTRREE